MSYSIPLNVLSYTNFDGLVTCLICDSLTSRPIQANVENYKNVVVLENCSSCYNLGNYLIPVIRTKFHGLVIFSNCDSLRSCLTRVVNCTNFVVLAILLSFHSLVSCQIPANRR